MSSFCGDQVALLAGQIYSGIGAPTSQSIAFVSGWITSSGALGELNNRLNTSFWISSGTCIAGGFTPSEGHILALTYEHDYYRRRALEVMQGAGLAWTSIKEADSSVTRESPTKLSAEYRSLASDIQDDLYVAVANWKLGVSLAVSVESTRPASWPTP